MRIVKLGLISFVVLFLLITGISLFIPSHIRISKAINIRADKETVLAQISEAERWKNWYPGLDSARLLYEGDMIKGVMIDEESNASLVITKKDTSEISAQFLTKKLRPVTNVWRVIEAPTKDSVVLQWYMDFHLRWYPWEKLSSLVLEGSYGSKMEQGLSNLRKLVESSPVR